MADRINERFRLERVVEEGPEGSWHRGVDEKNDKPVLVATTTRAADEWTRNAFAKLQEVGRRVSHPAVARFVESGTSQSGSPYVVVDLPTGPTLADRLLITPPLSIHELIRMMISVLDGLQAAHRQGLVHGDIEPGSIVVTGEGRACLTRFGLNRAAAIARRVPSLDGVKLGRSKRMAAPELIAGEPPSVASDLYSIGAILYEAIAGRGHRRDETPSAEALPLRDARAQVPAALAEVVDALLAKDPKARPDSASTLRRDLTQAMMKAPTVAKLKVATAIEAPQAEPTQQLDIEDLESQASLQETLAASEAAKASPATRPSEAEKAEPSVVVAGDRAAAPVERAEPARAASSAAPADEKSKAPLVIGLALAVIIIIALVSMLGGGDEAAGEAAPALEAETVAAESPVAAPPTPAAAIPAPVPAPAPVEAAPAEPAAAPAPVEAAPAAAPRVAPKKKVAASTKPATSSPTTTTNSKVKRNPGF
jgi:eukaryotic-like serine/threonine-protein kinase